MTAGNQSLENPALAHGRPPQATAAHARARAALKLHRLAGSWMLKVTAALGVAWLVTGWAWGRGPMPWHGLAGMAFAVAVIAMLLRLTGYLAVETLWSLRNRLVAAYVLVAVVPVLLIAGMMIIGAYLFGGQFAAFLLANELHQRQYNVEELNQVTQRALDRNPNRTPAQQDSFSQLYASVIFPSGVTASSYFFHADGTPADQRAKANIGTLPGWLGEDTWAGLESDSDGYALMNYQVDAATGERVLTVYPLGPRVLNILAANLGEVQLAQQNEPVNGAARPPTLASIDPLRPRRNFFDREIFGSAFIPSYDWHTGQKNKLLATIATRPSLLYEQLFGDFSAATAHGPNWVLLLLEIVGGIFLIIEAFALVAGMRLTGTITSAVDDLYVGTEHINRGDFDHRIPVKSRDQLAALEISFNDMTTSIRRLLEEQRQKQRLESELAIAHEVQAQLFPRTPPAAPGLEIYGRCLPARVVSGDYYDFSEMNGQQVSLALGDISGKGISAALLMATIVAAVRAYQPAWAEPVPGQPAPPVSPARLIERLNQQLFHSTPPEKYATLFYAVYDHSTHTLRYTNAGHLPPVVLNGQTTRRLEQGGMVVGLFEGVSFEEAAIELAKGDLLAAWSDGITEPENEYGVEFGEERLIELLRENRERPLAEIAQRVLAGAADWSGNQEQADDVTLVLARVTS